MSRIGAAPRAAVPSAGAPTRAATQVSNARAEASRKNGAKSRGPKTPEGKARSSRNALQHGMRAQKYVVLPDEDAVEFAQLQTALFDELEPVGALQIVLARRVAIAAWRLARADRIEAELFAEQRWNGGDLGLALIRDGNGTRSFETLMRYRGAAMAEFMRALRTLKALQAGQAATDGAVAASPSRPAARRTLAHPPGPDEPERGAPQRLAYASPEPPVAGRALHEPAAPWRPNEPKAERPARVKPPEMPAAAALPGRPPHSMRGEPEVGAPASHQEPSAVDRTNPGAR